MSIYRETVSMPLTGHSLNYFASVRDQKRLPLNYHKTG